MKTTDEYSLRVLNLLIQAGEDAERGFQNAATAVKEPELARLFAEFAAQRTKFVAELQQRVRALRAEPLGGDSLAAAAHRGWTNLRAAIASNETHAILVECERGEDAAVGAYAQALKEHDVDGQTRTLIQSQYELVQAAHDRVKQLRDSETYAHR
jgi:uncharacterized protein (TIGR02284 family)